MPNVRHTSMKEFQDIKTQSGQIGLNTDNEGLLQHLRFLNAVNDYLRSTEYCAQTISRTCTRRFGMHQNHHDSDCHCNQ